MDVKQIEYIVKIADERSITRAAEKLFITQSALNQQLLRLEKELGAQLFRRNKTDLQPTPIGEVYLENAREILRIRHRTYNQINDMLEAQKGRLSIALTPGRGIDMFTNVYPAFHQKYPDVIVEPHELSVHRQQAMIAQGNLDIGFQTLARDQQTDNEYQTLASEEIFLAVPAAHPLASLAAPPGEPFRVIDISAFRYEPFVLMYRESTIRALVDAEFRRSGFTPHILFETASSSTIVAMVKSRQCCGVLPYYYLKNCSEDIACFAFASHPTWDIAVSYRKNSYLSDPAKAFIALAREFWQR